jgi:phage gpG-like protein
MSRPLSELPGALSVVERLLVDVIAGSLTTILKTAEDRARQNVSGRILQARSGRLRASIGHRISVQGSDVRGTLTAGSASVRYARIHEEGGIINGRPWLTYQIPGVGWRRSMSVRIPRRPYLQPALEQAQRDLGEELTRDLRPLLSLEARG